MQRNRNHKCYRPLGALDAKLNRFICHLWAYLGKRIIARIGNEFKGCIVQLGIQIRTVYEFSLVNLFERILDYCSALLQKL
jgi:hypothetical protein